MSRRRSGFILWVACLISHVGSSAGAEPEPYVPSPGAGLVRVHAPKQSAGNDIDAVWQRQIRTHAALLCQRWLYQCVVLNETSAIRRTGVFDKMGDAPRMVEWMEKNVHVRSVPGTALIEVSVTPTADPRDAQTIVMEIVKQYLTAESERGFVEGQQRAQVLAAQRTKIRGQYNETNLRLAHLIARPPDDEEKAGYIDNLELTRRQRDKLLEKLDRIQDRLDELEASQSAEHLREISWAVMPEQAPTTKPAGGGE